MYYQLGDIRFEGQISPSALQEKRAANYAQHPRIASKATLQRLGDPLDEIDLSILFHSRFCSPEQERDRLLAAMASTDGLPLITGAGRSLGTFVITEIVGTTERADKDGDIIAIRLDVKLLEKVNTNSLGMAEDEAIRTGFAYDTNAPVETLRPIPPQSLTSAASADLIAANIASVQAVSALEGGDLQATSSGLAAQRDALQAAGTKIAATTGSINTTLQGLETDINLLLLEVSNVKEAADAANIALAQAGLEDYTVAQQQVKRSDARLAGIVATRRG